MVFTGLYGWFEASPRRFFRTGLTFKDKDQQKVLRGLFLFAWFCVILGAYIASSDYGECLPFAVNSIIIILAVYVLSRTLMIAIILCYDLWRWINAK